MQSTRFDVENSSATATAIPAWRDPDPSILAFVVRRRDLIAANEELMTRLATATRAVEEYATACRRAADQIKRIVETFPENRYRSQQAMLRLAAEGLAEQADAITLGTSMKDPEIIRETGILGRLRLEYAIAALAAVPGSISAGFDIADHLKSTNETIVQINSYNEEIVVDMNSFIVELDVTTTGGEAGEELHEVFEDQVGISNQVEGLPDDEVGGAVGASPEPDPPSTPGGAEARTDATVRPATVEARADVPTPTIGGDAVTRGIGIAEERDQALPFTPRNAAESETSSNPAEIIGGAKVRGRKAVSETSSGTASIETEPDTAEGEGTFTPPPAHEPSGP